MFRFAITAHFIDMVELDVVPLDITGVVSGSPYLYDRIDIFHRHENKYHLFKDSKEYIVRAHRKKIDSYLVNAGKMKRLVNASQKLTLMMIKQREVVYNPFHLNSDVNNELFQSERKLSLKEDDKKLQQSSLVTISAENKVLVQEGAKL